MDYNIKYNYKPYAGGAGGDQDHYNKLLMDALTAEGIQHHTSMFEEADPPFLIIHVGDKQASYDRWGYCSDDEDMTLDQNDLDDTLRYLME